MANRMTHLAHPPHHPEAAPAPHHSGGLTTLLRVEAYQGETVVVTSDAVGVDGRIDPLYAQEGDDVSPPLAWSEVAEAQGWAVIVEDPDAPAPEPVLHWAIWDLPGALTALPAAIEKLARPVTPQDAVQGVNSHGASGWMGPKPPPGHGVHRYHFQVFALSAPLGVGPQATREEIVSALKGKVIASGEVVGTYETPDPANLDSPGRTSAYAASPETA